MSSNARQKYSVLALGAFAAVLVFSVSSQAQITTGLPTFGSFSGSSFDTVNNANLDVHFEIPVENKAGRGLPFSYALSYDSSIWQPIYNGSTTNWSPFSTWGWPWAPASLTGSMGYNSTQVECAKDQYYTKYVFGPFYTDPSGTSHEMLVETNTANSTCGISAVSTGSSSALDGSGLTLVVTNYNHAVIYPPSGSSILPLEPPSNLNGSITDPNGNQIKVSTSGGTSTFTDTLGTTALTVTGSGTPSSPVSYTYTDFDGSPATVTVRYIAYTVRTNFGCSGITEFGPTSENLVSEVDLPDGTKYTLTYEPTPGYAADVTARIASVTLPTGGTISYSYSGGNNGITCADGTAATLTRITPDGAWTYAHSESGSAWTTTETDPQNNKTAFNFQGIYETERQVYQGSSTVLRTTYTCYNGAAAPCNGTTVSLPIASRSVTLATDTNLQSKTVTDYNAYGLPTETDEYGYGSGAPGSLGRKTVISYATLGNNIEDQPSEVQVYTGSGGLAAQTSYSYDTVGNLKTLTENTAASSTISRSFTYGTGGVLATATDFAGNSTSFTYNDCNNSFPTSIAQPLSLTSSMSWNCNAGQVSSVTDPNNQTTSYDYDEFGRLARVNNPDGGETQWTYNDGPSGSVIRMLKLSASQDRTDTAILDSLGRATQTQLNSDPAGTDYVNTTYDSLGRPVSVTNPFRSSSTGGDTYSYDALSRITGVTHADSNAAHTYYGSGVGSAGGLTSQLCSSATYGLGYPALFSDEDGNMRERWTDSLGRVIEVDEPDPATGSLTDGSESATCYSYNALGDLIEVVQGAQTRTYNYDMLSRLVSATPPESGMTSYGYSGCSGDPPNVCTRTDARGITTTYRYDALNRLTAKSYSDGTPVANFWYDNNFASFGGWSATGLTNTKGRLYATCTSNVVASCPGGYSGTVYSYDAMGRVTNYWQCTPYNCGSSAWQMTYSYDLSGDVTSWTHPAGFTLTNTTNGAQEITQIQSSLVDSTHPQYLAQNVTYTPWGAEQTLENGCAGSGCTNALETYVYNNRLQPVMIELGNTSNPTANYCLVYNYYGNSGNPASCSLPAQSQRDNNVVLGYFYQDNVDSSLSHTAAHAHDYLNRLMWAQATGSSTYYLTFSYDRYGNMTCTVNGSTNGLCPQYSFNESNNQITNSGFTYDADGDLTADGVHTYQYDAEGHLISIDNGSTASFNNNAFGWRVYWGPPTQSLTYWHDAAGQELGGYWSGNWNGFIYFGWRELGDYQAGGGLYFAHANDQRSTSEDTNWTGTGAYPLLLYPWGQVWQNPTGEIGDSLHQVFAGLEDYDPDLDQYQPMFRRYAPSLGRWLTPDPLGGDITNPQSLNRYAYALNNPTTLTDPSGLGPPCSGQQQCASYGQNYATYQWWSSIWSGGGREFDYAFYPGYESEGEFVPGGIDPSGFALAGAGLFGPFDGVFDTPGSLPVYSPGLPETNLAQPCAPSGNAPDPSYFEAKGLEAYTLETAAGVPAPTGSGALMNLTGLVLNGYNLYTFHRGGLLDAQVRYGGSQAYANYVFGVYTNSAGFSLSLALSSANAYGALFSTYPPRTVMDTNYPHIPAANVANIANGFNDAQNGTLCSPY